MCYCRNFIILCFSCFAITSEGCEIKTQDNLPVYTAKIELAYPLPVVLAALSDVEHLNQWLILANKASVISESGRAVNVHLFLNGAMGQQDVVLRTFLDDDKRADKLSICMESIESQLLPNVSRLKMLNVKWTLLAAGQANTVLTLNMQVNTGFSIPFWFNGFVRLAPQKSLDNLKAYLGKTTAYQQPLAFIKAVDKQGFFNEVLVGW